MKRKLIHASLVPAGLMLLCGCAARGDFTLDTLDGRRMSLSGQKGKTVLLAFWAEG